MPTDRASSPDPTPPVSLWGGQAGRLLPAAEQVVGARVVTPEGRHGWVLAPPYHAVHYGRPGHRIPMDAGFTKVRYESGAIETRLATELYQELVPANMRLIVHDPPAWRLDGRVDEDERMTVEALLRAVIEVGERARSSAPAAAAALRERLSEPLSRVLSWRQKLIDTPIRARLSTFEILRLRYEVFGTPGDPQAEQQLVLMASLPPDWRIRWKVGQIVRGPESEAYPERDGWTVERILGDEALLVGYGRERWAPLWLLEPDYTAGYYPLPSEPVGLYDLASELYSRYSGRSPALALEASRAEERAYWQALPPALTTWLREQGLPLKVDRKASRLHLVPPRTPLTPDERSRLERLLSDLAWMEDGGAFLGDVLVPPEHVGRVSALIGHALREQGLHLSALGEARRHQNASACEPVVFELKGHGTIRVDCGDPSNPEAWHSLYVKDVRFAWGGGRWMKNKLPPLAVLEAVRQRGIRVFG